MIQQKGSIQQLNGRHNPIQQFMVGTAQSNNSVVGTTQSNNSVIDTTVKANRRNVNIVLIQSLKCYLENVYSRMVLLCILVLTYTSFFDNR